MYQSVSELSCYCQHHAQRLLHIMQVTDFVFGNALSTCVCFSVSCILEVTFVLEQRNDHGYCVPVDVMLKIQLNVSCNSHILFILTRNCDLWVLVST